VRQYPIDPQTAAVARITIISATPPSLGPGDTHQLVTQQESAPIPAEGGGLVPVVLTGRTVTYVSSNTGVVTVSASGLVSHVGAGTAPVTATSGGVSTSEVYTCVTPQAAVASVDTNPATFTLAVGATVQLTAAPRDASGNFLPGRVVTWGTSNASFATVSADSGTDAHIVTVTGIAAGSVTITPTSETVAGSGSAGTVAVVLADGLAELPREYVVVAYSLPAGAVYTVKNSGGDYLPTQMQTALNDAATNGIKVIVVDDDVVITRVAALIVPAKAWDDWTYVVTASVHNASFPRSSTQRVLAADIGQMAKFVTAQANQSILTFSSGAAHPAKYRFAGFQMTSTVTGGTGIQGALFSVNGGAEPTFQPRDIILDRCLLSGIPGTNFVRRGVRLDGIRCAVVNCRIAGIVDANNSDSQAVWCHEAVGPLRISNNYLEAAAENFMSGGVGGVANLPSDIHFHNNHCFKPESWIGVYAIKNQFELKTGQRVLVENNVFENCWVSGQTGTAFVLKSDGQSGANLPQMVVRDVVVRNNHVKGCVEWWSLSAAQSTSTQTMTNVTIRGNLCSNPRGTGNRNLILKGSGARPIEGLTFENNTLIGTTSYLSWVMDPGSAYTGTKSATFAFNDNIVYNGSSSGWWGASAVAAGMANISAQWTTVSVERNGTMGVKTSGAYPASNIGSGAQTVASAQFVDSAAGNYRLGAGSPFKGIGLAGADPGMNQDTLEAAIAGVV